MNLYVRIPFVNKKSNPLFFSEYQFISTGFAPWQQTGGAGETC
jgi:hypothetical protein